MEQPIIRCRKPVPLESVSVIRYKDGWKKDLRTAIDSAVSQCPKLRTVNIDRIFSYAMSHQTGWIALPTRFQPAEGVGMDLESDFGQKEITHNARHTDPCFMYLAVVMEENTMSVHYGSLSSLRAVIPEIEAAYHPKEDKRHTDQQQKGDFEDAGKDH